jgi:hypothetical protein
MAQPIGSLQAFYQKGVRERAEEKSALTRQSDVGGFKSASDFETLAGKTPQSRTNTVAFAGGFLSPQEFSRAQFLQKEGLTADFETKQAAANEANEARYSDILEQFGTTIEGATTRGPETLQFNEADFAGLGDQARKDIFLSFRNLGAKNTQSLVSSGLAGTTARGAVQANVARGRTAALGTLNENLRRERIGYGQEIDRFNASTRNAYGQYLDSLTAQKLSFMERREDEGPDQAQFLQQLREFGNI